MCQYTYNWKCVRKLYGCCTDVLTNTQTVIQTVIETVGIYGTDVQAEQ